MDKLKFLNISPLAKSKRMAKCITRMIQPTPKIVPDTKPGWTTCPIQDCKAILTRECDLIRHRYESHQDLNSFNCTHCISTYKRQHTLNLHIRKFHACSLIKKMDSSTQTVLYKESDMRYISPLEISRGFIDPNTNTLTGNLGSSNLLLMETNLKIVSKKHEAEKIKICKTCEFKRKSQNKVPNKVSTISKNDLDTQPPSPKRAKLETDTFLESIFALDDNASQTEGPKTPKLFDMPTFDLNFFNTTPIKNDITNNDTPQTTNQSESTATTSDYLLDPNDPNITSIIPTTRLSSHSSSSSTVSSTVAAATLLQDTLLREDLAISPSSSSGSLDEVNIDYLSPPQTEVEFINLMIELNS